MKDVDFFAIYEGVLRLDGLSPKRGARDMVSLAAPRLRADHRSKKTGLADRRPEGEGAPPRREEPPGRKADFGRCRKEARAQMEQVLGVVVVELWGGTKRRNGG